MVQGLSAVQSFQKMVPNSRRQPLDRPIPVNFTGLLSVSDNDAVFYSKPFPGRFPGQEHFFSTDDYCSHLSLSFHYLPGP
jgi:hypothetical protein